MTGLRERKKRMTFKAIHDAALKLFDERGYGAVTVADIAEQADVSRATVFAYYPAKEDIVLGDAPLAVEGLRQALDAAAGRARVVDTVRDWLRTLTGWIEPDAVLQHRLALEIPAVAAARSRLQREIEDVIAAALEREMGPSRPLAPRLVAGSLAAALVAVDREAVQRMEQRREPLSEREVEDLLDRAVAFVDGGLERLSGERGDDTAVPLPKRRR